MRTFTRLADILELVSADGLDPDALALIVSEALGEDPVSYTHLTLPTTPYV